MTPSVRPAVALVLATYNRAVPLERLLECLEHQTGLGGSSGVEWELIVVVDGSTDDSVKVLERWVSRGTLPLRFFVQGNTGQAAARHNGILKTEAPHIVVIDDDMEVCR